MCIFIKRLGNNELRDSTLKLQKTLINIADWRFLEIEPNIYIKNQIKSKYSYIELD